MAASLRRKSKLTLGGEGHSAGTGPATKWVFEWDYIRFYKYFHKVSMQSIKMSRTFLSLSNLLANSIFLNASIQKLIYLKGQAIAQSVAFSTFLL